MFQVGDIVSLKTGSNYKMCVQEKVSTHHAAKLPGIPRSTTAYYCVWLNYHGVDCGRYFAESVLTQFDQIGMRKRELD